MRYLITIFLLLFVVLYGENNSLVIEKNVTIGVKTSLKGIVTSHVTIDEAKKIEKLMITDLKVATGYILDKTELVTPENNVVNNDGGSDLNIVYTLTKVGNILQITLSAKEAKATNNFQKSYKITDPERYPFLVHKCIGDLSRFMKLPPPAWMEKFIVFSRNKSAGQSDIYLADYTLTYQKQITKGGLNIFPKWESASQDVLFYTRYDNGVYKLYRLELYNKKRDILAQSQGMLTCTDVSSDKNKLLLTMAPEGQPEIFLYDQKLKGLQQLTSFIGMDIAAGFLGKNGIAFISDRLGTPQIFHSEMNATASALPFGFKGKQTSFITSPHYILYAVEAGGGTSFQLADLKGNHLKSVVAIGNNLFARLAPSEDAVLFLRHKDKKSSIVINKLVSGEEFSFTIDGLKIQSLDW